MYLADTHVGEAAKKQAAFKRPFGPGAPAEIAEKTEKVEVWCSNFSDPGPDRTVFKLYDKSGVSLGSAEVGGY